MDLHEYIEYLRLNNIRVRFYTEEYTGLEVVQLDHTIYDLHWKRLYDLLQAILYVGGKDEYLLLVIKHGEQDINQRVKEIEDRYSEQYL